MDRSDVIAKIKTVEPLLRARGVGSLYLFGSYGRDQARSGSDIDVFVEADDDAFYDLSNYMGVYRTLSEAFPRVSIGYSTRDGLSNAVRTIVENEAVRVF